MINLDFLRITRQNLTSKILSIADLFKNKQLLTLLPINVYFYLYIQKYVSISILGSAPQSVSRKGLDPLDLLLKQTIYCTLVVSFYHYLLQLCYILEYHLKIMQTIQTCSLSSSFIGLFRIRERERDLLMCFRRKENLFIIGASVT